MKNRVITISREFGSGGRTIGKETAKKLGIPCYDQELIERAAQESGFAEEYIAREGEYTGGGKWFSNAYAGIGSNYKMSNQDQLWLIQRKIILDLAEKESCVIVGRCADYILKEAADCLRVFIHADMEKRAERIVKVYGESDVAPEKRLKEKDKRRSAYYRFYTETEWGQAKNYHLCLDSGALGIETCVSVLVGLY